MAREHTGRRPAASGRPREPAPRWRVAGLAGLALIVLLAAGWRLAARETAAATAASPVPVAPAPVAPAVPPATADRQRPPSAPYTAAAEQARAEQHALWQERLEHAERARRHYREATRYPPTAQPLRLHADQAYPQQPIVEEQALVGAGGRASGGVKLRTSQDRVYVQGDESVGFAVALHDAEGRVQPLRIVRASAREVPAPGTASLHPVVSLPFNDDGLQGDLVAGDGSFGARLHPHTQGFAGLAGQIRVELILQHRDQEGPLFFDIFYTPRPPALWQGRVRETLEDGSLHLGLGVQVHEAGRYVVSARVDDAHGVPFALLSFNDELEAGAREFRLTLFGKLVRDARPAFPLTLRDVEAFLLRPDTFPDRSLLPRLAGPVHRTQEHVLASFADAEWQSEQRERHLRELDRDAARAQAQVNRYAARP